MKIKYQIFISSTFEDLKEIREQVIKCILEMGHIPVGMEMFSAANEDQWKVIQKQIDDCDYYLVIIAHRYGSLDNDISFTEKEYDYAVSKGIPIMGFIIDETTKWSAKFIDSDDTIKQKLIRFKEKVKTRMISFWKSSDDIYGKTAVALSKAFVSYSRPGYVRSDEVVNKDVYIELTRLSTENAELRKNLSDIKIENEIEIEKKETRLLSILESTKKVVSVRLTGSTEWHEFTLTLLEIFIIIAERILIESDELSMQKAIALAASNNLEYDKKIPVASNHFAQWLADMHALELIIPSRKKHLESDTTKYWTLTTYGNEIFSNIRKLKLIAGIPMKKEPEDYEQVKIISENIDNQ